MSSRHPRLSTLATATPPHIVHQQAVKQFAAALFSETVGEDRRLLDIFDHAAIQQRHLCVDLSWLGADHSLSEKNDRYVEYATELACEVVTKALDRARTRAADIDHLVFVSSTGIATPSIDALIANRIGCRTDVRRTPIWGLGCAGGVAGLARARDLALGDPAARVMLVAIELCSLTFQKRDLSRRNFVASALFADGAAAALVVGADVDDRASNPQVSLELVASRSVLWPGTTDVMGWSVEDDGLHVVFSQDIPMIVREKVRPSLLSFLDRHGLALEDVAHLVTHPGGAKVLQAYTESLGADPAHFRHAREILRRFGNMSSPSCLFVLERFMDAGEIAPGDHAVLTALGPGFSAEYVLLRGRKP